MENGISLILLLYFGSEKCLLPDSLGGDGGKFPILGPQWTVVGFRAATFPMGSFTLISAQFGK